MSALTNRLRNAPKPLRVIALLLLIVLLVLLIAYALLEYLAPPGQAPAPVPTNLAAASPTTAAADSPIPTATPRPTQTPVVKQTPESLSEEGDGDMEALAEEAGPLTAPTTAPSAPVIDGETPSRSLVPESIDNLLANSDFNQGFQENGVAQDWKNFNNSDSVFSYRSDDWPWVKEEGGQTQIIRIKDAGLPDRYAGIYQVVDVVPGQVYTFTISGLVRTNAGDVQHTNFGYRMEVGFDPSGGRSWKAVDEWMELPWDEQLRQQNEYRFDRYTTTVTADSSKLTVFIRGWKKWADAGEGAFNIDSASLVGPVPAVAIAAAAGDVSAMSMPVTGQEPVSPFTDARGIVTFGLLALLVGGTIWRVAHKRG
jgi:hypothetical protein